MTLLFENSRKYHQNQMHEICFDITAPALVFLYGDLGAGKTTLVSQYIANMIGKKPEDITSPTYTYYNIYGSIYHFDLYRLHSYDQFVSIGGEEILDTQDGLIFVEWPQILEPYYTPDISIYLTHDSQDENIRHIEIKKYDTTCGKK